MAAKIRATWPDGAICGICFTTALRTRGSCPHCGKDRLLPGRTTDGTDICRDCAGITTNMTCEGCGSETERFRAGHCIRCVLRTDLEGMVHPTPSPGPEPQTPHRSARRRGQARERLHRDGAGPIPRNSSPGSAPAPSRSLWSPLTLFLRHDQWNTSGKCSSITACSRTGAANSPPFEQSVAVRVHDLAETPHIQAPIERFARWHHLKRLRQMAGPGKSLNTAVRSAKQEITESGKFLAWLGADHGLAVASPRGRPT